MTSTYTTIDHAATRTKPAWRSICIGGAVGWLAGTVAVEAYAAIGRAAGVPMKAGAPGAHSAQHLTAAAFAMAVFVCALIGTVLALLLARYSQRPVRTFVGTAIALTAVSLGSPLAATHTSGSTKGFLACGHLLVACIVIPCVAHQIRPSGTS
jgi:peptidoglycan/LPS O-acetylase OafA/YrhL